MRRPPGRPDAILSRGPLAGEARRRSRGGLRRRVPRPRGAAGRGAGRPARRNAGGLGGREPAGGSAPRNPIPRANDERMPADRRPDTGRGAHWGRAARRPRVPRAPASRRSANSSRALVSISGTSPSRTLRHGQRRRGRGQRRLEGDHLQRMDRRRRGRRSRCVGAICSRSGGFVRGIAARADPASRPSAVVESSDVEKARPQRLQKKPLASSARPPFGRRRAQFSRRRAAERLHVSQICSYSLRSSLSSSLSRAAAARGTAATAPKYAQVRGSGKRFRWRPAGAIRSSR